MFPTEIKQQVDKKRDIYAGDKGHHGTEWMTLLELKVREVFINRRWL